MGNRGSTVDPNNLLGTCLKCHSGQPDFTVAGQAHISASSRGVKAVGYIEGFFGYFIPTMFGLLAVFIVLDGRKVWSERNNQAGKNNE
jgi:hypothetical protein